MILLKFGTGSPTWEPNFRTEHLLALEACRPLEAKVYQRDWLQVTTPLKVEVFEAALASHPDQDFRRYICSGIRHGFHVGFNYQHTRCRPARDNMKSAQEHGVRSQTNSWPVSAYQSSLGSSESLRGHPKSEPGKWRLILDLSSPNGYSVNDGIAKDLCSLSYVSIDDIVARVVNTGRGAMLAKFDLKSAYRQIPVHPDDKWLLGMDWNVMLYVDSTLRFGLRSAPAI